MATLVVRAGTVIFALGMLGAVVAHASVTSGCSKPDVVRDVAPSERAVPTAAATATATATATVKPAASAKPPASAKPAEPRFMPASKSGGMFRGSDFQQQQAPNPSPANAR